MHIRPEDWLPAPPPMLPVPRFLVAGGLDKLFRDYIHAMEVELGRPLTVAERAQEWELWRITLLETLHPTEKGVLPGGPGAQVQPSDEVEALLAAKQQEWERRGYPPGLIRKATTLAREWPAGLLASPLYKAVRGTPTEQPAALGLYRMGIDVAERWIATMSSGA